MIIHEQQVREQNIRQVAEQMMLAARTAPKGRGRDTLFITAVYGESLAKIADKMEEMGKNNDVAFFIRDALNVRASQAVVFIGTRIEALGLSHCGMCGMHTCEQKLTAPEVPCTMNTVDLGIAIGSAVSVASDHRVDNRVMFSAGKAAIALDLFGERISVAFGIPLCCSAKSPFFDRG